MTNYLKGTTILERKMKMTNISVLYKLWILYKKYFRFIWVIFGILGCYMLSYIGITIKGDNNTEIICLWIFVMYLLWCTYRPKDEYLYSIPLFLYVIGYYVIHGGSLCEITQVLWQGILG